MVMVFIVIGETEDDEQRAVMVRNDEFKPLRASVIYDCLMHTKTICYGGSIYKGVVLVIRMVRVACNWN